MRKDKFGMKRKEKERRRKARHPGRYKGDGDHMGSAPSEWMEEFLKDALPEKRAYQQKTRCDESPRVIRRHQSR